MKDDGKMRFGWFNKEFIFTGEINRKYGRIPDNAYNNKPTGDYDNVAEFDEEDVKKSFDEMKQRNQSITVSLIENKRRNMWRGKEGTRGNEACC